MGFYRIRGDLGRSALLFAVLLLSYAYFYQAGGWNQNSRFDLTRAIVEHATLRIDAYHENTGDKARVGEHYYSDKAPGVSLLAVPAVALLDPWLRAVRIRPESPSGVAWRSWAATVATSGVATAASGVMLFQLALGLGATPAAALFGALVLGLGSPAWCQATLFYGHATAMAWLLAALLGATALGRASSARRDAILALGVGGAGGCAVVTEYPAAPAAALLGALALFHAARGGPRRGGRVLLGIAAGALGPLLVLLAYNQLAFGGPLTPGYAELEGLQRTQGVQMGLTPPTPTIAREILFGAYRGLLPLSPLLLLAPLGWAWMARRAATRPAALAAAAVALYYLLLAMSVHHWHGGWSVGPRHLVPALPMLCLPLAWLWDAAPVWLRAGLAGAAAYGAAVVFVAVSTTAQPPNDYARPMEQLAWPAFLDGELSLNTQSFLEARPDPPILRGVGRHRDAWNMGQRFGLDAHASLAPLAVGWAVLLAAWAVLERRRAAPDPAPGPARDPGRGVGRDPS
jgi:hypothetical protein